MTISHLPVKGMPTDPPPLFSDPHPLPNYHFQSSSGPAMYPSTGRLPKLPFPTFLGDNPKLWQSHVESYFDMHGVDNSFWVKLSSMYFDCPAARWFQNIERNASHLGWNDFCKLIHDRFGRDQHELFIRQLFHIRQTGTVADYVERFAELVDQLSAYTSSTDPLYYTLRFIDGLRDDIKSVVLVQRPQDLDTACVLAALQEEVGDSSRRREFRCPDPPQPPKPASRGPLPLPAPPRTTPTAPTQADDHRCVEASCAGSSAEARATALRTYRRAMGL